MRNSGNTRLDGLKVPVVFIIHRRPELTRKVFSAVERARPTRLFVISDGPRNDDESPLVDECRAITETVSWQCEIYRNYSDSNLGCGQRVSSGLDWVFENVEQAIILEDDTLPNNEFFFFCEMLLERYKDDERVMHIGGTCLHRMPPTDDSYYFSKYTGVWGWATWARAWGHYDFSLKFSEKMAEMDVIEAYCDSESERNYWHGLLVSMREGKIDTWDYQWKFSCWMANGLSIVPRVNLVSNLGFGPNATHTVSGDARFAKRPIERLGVLHHPQHVVRNKQAEDEILKLFLPAEEKPNWFQRGTRSVVNRLSKLF